PLPVHVPLRLLPVLLLRQLLPKALEALLSLLLVFGPLFVGLLEPGLLLEATQSPFRRGMKTRIRRRDVNLPQRGGDQRALRGGKFVRAKLAQTQYQGPAERQVPSFRQLLDGR